MIIQRLLGLGLSQLAYWPICYKQEMEALFLVWYSGYDVFDTFSFSITNLFAAKCIFFATQRFIHSFYVKIKHVVP